MIDVQCFVHTHEPRSSLSHKERNAFFLASSLLFISIVFPLIRLESSSIVFAFIRYILARAFFSNLELSFSYTLLLFNFRYLVPGLPCSSYFLLDAARSRTTKTHSDVILSKVTGFLRAVSLQHIRSDCGYGSRMIEERKKGRQTEKEK